MAKRVRSFIILYCSFQLLYNLCFKLHILFLVPVLKVLENPTRATNQSSLLVGSLQCSCGAFYSPSSACPGCGTHHINHVNGSVTHSAEVHRHYNDDSDDDSDEAIHNQERRALLSSNINTPTKDVRLVTEYGSLQKA